MFEVKKCVEYAKKYAYDYNPAYYDFSLLGGDCTNFVSQCLFAGGIKMNYSELGWYYISLNNRAPAWTGVNEFWNFGIKNNGAGFFLAPCDLRSLDLGDIIQLGNSSTFYHSLIVTGVSSSPYSEEILVSAHDSNAFNIPLSRYAFDRLRCAKVKENV